MFTIAIISAVSVATSVVAVIKTKQIVSLASNCVPTQGVI